MGGHDSRWLVSRQNERLGMRLVSAEHERDRATAHEHALIAAFHHIGYTVTFTPAGPTSERVVVEPVESSFESQVH